MSIEQAMIALARPRLMMARFAEVLQREAMKGCDPQIAGTPLAIEPAYQPINLLGGDDGRTEPPWTLEPPIPPDDLIRLDIWTSPQQSCAWGRAELFLKQLAATERRLALEVVGNRERIASRFVCHRDDEAVLATAFASQYEECTLAPAAMWHGTTFDAPLIFDYYPCPPYSHLFTRPRELERSPYFILLTALAQITPPALGVYQVILQAVHPLNNWHQNVKTLYDLEYMAKLVGQHADLRRYAQQAPGGDLRHMAGELESKAHNDKPFFATALRIGLLNGGPVGASFLRSLDLITRLFQHGGRPLRALDHNAYQSSLAAPDLQAMLSQLITYRPGFLTNSEELASMVHLPPPELAEQLAPIATNQLDTLPADVSLRAGTKIGYSEYGGMTQPVCIPLKCRRLHVHVLGRPGMGKSRLIEGMADSDIRRGAGVAVLDPHGDLVERILQLIREEDLERVVYFNPGETDWIPLWNPLTPVPGQDLGRTADDLVGAFKSFVDGWGDRLETLLRYVFHGALCTPGSTLLDVLTLFRKKSVDSQRLRAVALQAVDNAAAKGFWRHDFDAHSKDDFSPPRNKLSKLLLSGSVSLMLSQPDSAFSLRQIMDNGCILLVDLSSVGAQVRGIVGCLLLALLHQAALGRSTTPDSERREFHIYCDEAHRFMTEALEDLIAETRKFNVALTLVHQYLSQFRTRTADALASVGTTIMFSVDTRDAQHLKKDLQGLVTTEDLVTLEPFQAIARIGNRIARFRTDLHLQNQLTTFETRSSDGHMSATTARRR